ncbi:hypothetical protein Tco_0007776 [Tanacetum coccineum]
MKAVRSSSHVLIVPSLSLSSHIFASPVSDRGNIIRQTTSFLVSLQEAATIGKPASIGRIHKNLLDRVLQLLIMSDSKYSTVYVHCGIHPMRTHQTWGPPFVEGTTHDARYPNEPEQAPPSPVYLPYVPEPVYPEYMPPEVDVLPAEEQPLPAAASPTTESPGYIPKSDLEEDDKEDPEEDPSDYPARDRGNDG